MDLRNPCNAYLDNPSQIIDIEFKYRFKYNTKGNVRGIKSYLFFMKENKLLLNLF